MPTDFVRYTPEIEMIDPDLDRLMEQIIALQMRYCRTRWSRLSSKR